MDTKILKKGSLKGLGTYLSKLQGERSILLMRLNSLYKELRGNKEQIAAVELRLQQLKDKKLSVSEHAVLRYIERVEVIPPPEVEARIITEQLKDWVATLGDGTYPMEGFSVIVANNTVVTVIKK